MLKCYAAESLTLRTWSSLPRGHPEEEQWALLDHARHLRHTTPAPQLSCTMFTDLSQNQLAGTLEHDCKLQAGHIWQLQQITFMYVCISHAFKAALDCTTTRVHMPTRQGPEQASAILKQISSWVITIFSYHHQRLFCDASRYRHPHWKCKTLCENEDWLQRTMPYDITSRILAGLRLVTTTTLLFCICSTGTNLTKPLTTFSTPLCCLLLLKSKDALTVDPLPRVAHPLKVMTTVHTVQNNQEYKHSL